MTNHDSPAHDSIPQLTDQYHKGRKFYVLSSGVLLAWTLVGIELAKEPLESLKISLRNPEVAPVILVLLVLYFAYRTSVEWFQSDPRRRAFRASRTDFTITNILGVISVSVYSFQEISAINVGAYFAKSTAQVAVHIFGLGAGAYYVGRLLVWSFLTPPKTESNTWFYYRLPMLWRNRPDPRHPDPSVLGSGNPPQHIKILRDTSHAVRLVFCVILFPVSIIAMVSGIIPADHTLPGSPLTNYFLFVAACLFAWVPRYWKYDGVINPLLRDFLDLPDETTNY